MEELARVIVLLAWLLIISFKFCSELLNHLLGRAERVQIPGNPERSAVSLALWRTVLVTLPYNPLKA